MPKKETVLLANPETCADKIITLYHSSLFAGDQDVIKMYLNIEDKSLIPGLIHYLRSYIKGCHICQLSKNCLLDNCNRESTYIIGHYQG